MSKQPQIMGIERRTIAKDCEVRMIGDDEEGVGEGVSKAGSQISGVAAVFGSIYDMGWFTEEIAPGALDGADMSEVVALFNHDTNIPLARNSAGTLTLKIDAQNFAYSFSPPNSPNGENILEAIRRGDVKQSSWGFSIDLNGDVWEKRNGKDHRTITKVAKVWDVSPVTFPANAETNVVEDSLRARRDAFLNEIKLPENTTNSTLDLKTLRMRLRIAELS